MKERPIPFSAPMVRAILAGAKTQTRRPVKPQPEPRDCLTGVFHKGEYRSPVGDCPYGQPGDRLWVREPGRVVDVSQSEEESVHFIVVYLADKARRGFHLPERFDPQETNVWPSWVKEGRGIPNGIFREAARIHLEIVSVRVERVQEISGADVLAEGVDSLVHKYASYFERAQRDKFEREWNAIYASRGQAWCTNPWVWVVEFKRVAELNDELHILNQRAIERALEV